MGQPQKNWEKLKKKNGDYENEKVGEENQEEEEEKEEGEKEGEEEDLDCDSSATAAATALAVAAKRRRSRCALASLSLCWFALRLRREVRDSTSSVKFRVGCSCYTFMSVRGGRPAKKAKKKRRTE